MSGEGEEISTEAPAPDSSPAPAPAPAVEPQTAPPVITMEEQITTVKEQVVVKKTSPEKPSPAPAPAPSPTPVSKSDQAETRPRKPKSQPSPKVAEYTSSTRTPSSKSSYGKSSRGEYGDYLGVGAALAREFRGTSPSVLENISTHPLLYSPKYEPLKQPHLSARSRKVLRDAADLAVIAPGLRNLLEVQYHFFILFRSAYRYSFFCFAAFFVCDDFRLLFFPSSSLNIACIFFVFFKYIFLQYFSFSFVSFSILWQYQNCKCFCAYLHPLLKESFVSA